MGYFDEFHRGDYEITALAKKGNYTAGGTMVKCFHCENDIFEKHRITQLGPMAYSLICDNCSHVLWFSHAPKKVMD